MHECARIPRKHASIPCMIVHAQSDRWYVCVRASRFILVERLGLALAFLCVRKPTISFRQVARGGRSVLAGGKCMQLTPPPSHARHTTSFSCA